MAFSRELNPAAQEYQSLSSGEKHAFAQGEHIAAIAVAANAAILNKDANALEHLDDVLGTAGLSSSQANMVKGLVNNAIDNGQNELSLKQTQDLSQQLRPVTENRSEAITDLKEAAKNLATARAGGEFFVTPVDRFAAGNRADEFAGVQTTEKIIQTTERIEAKTVEATLQGNSHNKLNELVTGLDLPKLSTDGVNYTSGLFPSELGASQPANSIALPKSKAEDIIPHGH